MSRPCPIFGRAIYMDCLDCDERMCKNYNMQDKKIAIIDADLIYKPNKHNFPNLVCMKISSYCKQKGYSVELKLNYENLNSYYKVFISKVFTKTQVPKNVLKMNNVIYGGTGFYYDKAKPLPNKIEHIKPDYDLYNEYVQLCIDNGQDAKRFKYYTDYSIGFLTRGCFRKCSFCVNKNYNKSEKHSNVYEFYDESRPKLCFLDDNFLACKDWKEIIKDVKDIGIKFQFKQGLDERLLTEEKIMEVFSWNYDADYIFAFDNIEDRDAIESKLKMLYSIYPNFRKRIKFYVLVGYDRNGLYDEEFYKNDVKNAFIRCLVLAKYSALPYIMRYEKCYESELSGFYSTLASWCNQPNFFKKMSFETFSKCKGMRLEDYKRYKTDFDLYLKDGGKKYSTWRYYDELVKKFPQVRKLTKIVPDSILEYGNG